MRYVVEYEDGVDDQLAYCWLTTPDRKSVTAAQAQIDQLLARDPRHYGTELAEDLWQVEVPPLVAFYEIHDEKRIVFVTAFGIRQ